jgi:hypothetical protein
VEPAVVRALLSGGFFIQTPVLRSRNVKIHCKRIYIEQLQEFADRLAALTSVGETVECSMAQPPERSSLDDEHCLLDFGFVSRTPRPRRQNGGVVMRRHVGIGAIDQRVIETGLDDLVPSAAALQNRGIRAA